MNGYDILNALGSAGEAFVEEAQELRPTKKTVIHWSRLVSTAAACLAFAVLAGASLMTVYYFASPNQKKSEGMTVVSEAELLASEESLVQTEHVVVKTEEYSAPAARVLQEESDHTMLRFEGWVLPVEQVVIAGAFGQRANGIQSDHVNLAGPEGDRIVAVADGKVTETGYDATLGYYLILETEDGVLVKYAHLKDVTVEADQEVQQGEMVGSMGKTGRVTGPNLALTVYVDGVPVNPFR